MYCRSCGAKTDPRKARCPVCGENQRKRRFSFFALLAAAAACVLFAGVLVLGARLQREANDNLTVPAAQTAPVSESTTDNGAPQTVFVTHAGTKYHRDGCPHLSDSKEQISLADALRQGYEPCADCFPAAEKE